MFADKFACTSDAALQRIIAKKAEEAESFADLKEENCTLYAKTVITKAGSKIPTQQRSCTV